MPDLGQIATAWPPVHCTTHQVWHGTGRKTSMGPLAYRAQLAASHGLPTNTAQHPQRRRRQCNLKGDELVVATEHRATTASGACARAPIMHDNIANCKSTRDQHQVNAAGATMCWNTNGICYWGGHPRGPQTIPIFRTQNQGTRSSLMKTTSARQKALAKLKRADRNVLDASQC